MLDVKVKTIDGQDRSFSVPDQMLVKQLKEKIAPSIGISASTQRLIFRGRVLEDEKALVDYDVNGKTLHVVERMPPSATVTAASSQSATESESASGGRGQQPRESFYRAGEPGIIFGTVSLPLPTGGMNAEQMQNLMQEAFSRFTGSQMGGEDGDPNASDDGGEMGMGLDIHINVMPTTGTQPPTQQRSESQARMDQARRLINGVVAVLNQLENQSDTMSSASNGSAGASNPVIGNNGSQGVAPVTHVPVGRFATLLDEVFTLNTRLQRQMAVVQNVMHSDQVLQGEEATRIQLHFDRAMEAMHALGHIYHLLSDFVMLAAEPPPRLLRTAVAVQVQATTVVQQAVPMHELLNMATTGAEGLTFQSSRTTRSGSASPAPSAAGSGLVIPSTSSTSSSTSSASASAPRVELLQQYILGGSPASSTNSSLAFNGNGTSSSSATATPIAAASAATQSSGSTVNGAARSASNSTSSGRSFVETLGQHMVRQIGASARSALSAVSTTPAVSSDPYLACQSRHFADRQLWASQMMQPTEAVPGPPSLSDMVARLLSPLTARTQQRQRRTATTSTSTVTSSVSPAPVDNLSDNSSSTNALINSSEQNGTDSSSESNMPTSSGNGVHESSSGVQQSNGHVSQASESTLEVATTSALEETSDCPSTSRVQPAAAAEAEQPAGRHSKRRKIR